MCRRIWRTHVKSVRSDAFGRVQPTGRCSIITAVRLAAAAAMMIKLDNIHKRAIVAVLGVYVRFLSFVSSALFVRRYFLDFAFFWKMLAFLATGVFLSASPPDAREEGSFNGKPESSACCCCGGLSMDASKLALMRFRVPGTDTS